MPSAEDSGPLLLDTHCWVWMKFRLVGEFSSDGTAAVESAAGRGALLVSIISVWELAMLEAKGRIQLQIPCEVWVREALATPGLSLAPLTPEIAIDSTRLPGELHADPGDRILVATARRLDATLLTRDRKLLEYGRHRHARILSA